MFRLLSSFLLSLILLSTPAHAQTYVVDTLFTLTSLSTVRYTTNTGVVDMVLPPGEYKCDKVAGSSDPAPATVKSCTVFSKHVLAVAEGKPVTVAYPTRITYGAGDKWVTKPITLGAHTCSAAFFGTDPAPGVRKTCREVKQLAACKPRQFAGTGSNGLFVRNDQGCLASWYCPGHLLPVLIVATPARCNVSAARTFLADFLSNPSIAGMEELIAQQGTGADPWSNPALTPIVDANMSKITALRATLPK